MIVAGCISLLVGSTIIGAAGDAEGIFDVGVCTHFSQGKGSVELNIKSMKDVGITSIRDEAGWGSVERSKDKLEMPERYDRYVSHAAQEGLDVMIILDYSNQFYDDGDRPRSPEAIEGFCRYSEFVVGHFGKRVKYYEIWNEWDIPIGLPQRHKEKDGERNTGSPEDYFNLLKAVYGRIKAVDPDIPVIGGCPTPGGVRRGWLDKLVQLGGLEYCDMVSIHTYNYGMKGFDRTPEAWRDWMLEVQTMLREHNNGVDPPFCVTEMGWPTHLDERGTSPELSGSYLGRLYLLARTLPEFRGLWWYDYQDDGWNREYNENNFGIIRPDLTPKPAYYVMSHISDLIRHGEYVDRLDTPDENLWILRFRDEKGDVWAVWSGDDQDRQVIFETENADRKIILQELGHEPIERHWGHRNWSGSRDIDLNPQQLSVVVGHRPYLIKGDLSGVAVSDVILRASDR